MYLNMEMVEFPFITPKNKKVYLGLSVKTTGENYRKIAGDDKPGCVVSFEIKGRFKDFYNNLDLLKSPSFGTEFSICCPYIYLAHYDLISSKTGREELENAGFPRIC